MIPRVGSGGVVRYQDYLAGGSFPTTLNQPQQHWKIDMML
jgi:hypothetical protein